MPYLKTNTGINWHYTISGEGQCLLFIHGWSVDHRIWRQQIKNFQKEFKVMAVDLPGHGQTTWKNVAFEDMAKDIKQIFKQEGFNEVIIVGSSLGGLMSLKLYAIAAERIAKMIFVGSLPKFAKSETQPFGLDIIQIRKLSGQLETDYASIVNIFFRSLFTKEERETRRFKWIQKFRKEEDPPMKDALAEYLNILECEDLTDVLKNVKVSMQFINGTGDDICNAKAVDFLKQIVPQARFDWMQQCGHFSFLSTPEGFNKILEVFVKSV
ncbi:hypothetical protein MNBD_UNCLBAC01-1296 [hydrothermal vent metagenome]|uniref:AB hydrolase-1 domain-containing protein n=1 Tax=hydrothermal vent metagenome TaxID=652676 RepID=A0A3B1D7W3_9ZZZZ